MIGALLLALLQPAPPSMPRMTPVPALAWTCEIAGPSWRRVTLRGRFGEIPVGPGADGDFGAEAIVESAGPSPFAGKHRVYLFSGGRDRAAGMWTMIVRAPNRTFYHFLFHFYGETEIGSVTVEQQLLGERPERNRAAGAGFCRTVRGRN